jgi:hypothetical protein
MTKLATIVVQNLAGVMSAKAEKYRFDFVQFMTREKIRAKHCARCTILQMSIGIKHKFIAAK